mgnify:FL=1
MLGESFPDGFFVGAEGQATDEELVAVAPPAEEEEGGWARRGGLLDQSVSSLPKKRGEDPSSRHSHGAETETEQKIQGTEKTEHLYTYIGLILKFDIKTRVTDTYQKKFHLPFFLPSNQINHRFHIWVAHQIVQKRVPCPC